MEIIKENCKKDEGFVNTQDSRKSELDSRFQYRYRKQPRTGYTLLHYAVIYNCGKIIEELLKKQKAGMKERLYVQQERMLWYLVFIDPKKQHDKPVGSNPLHCGCLWAKKDTIKTFLECLR